ncbi:hypothetical protein ACJX0J_033495, partial [Zea mays]
LKTAVYERGIFYPYHGQAHQRERGEGPKRRGLTNISIDPCLLMQEKLVHFCVGIRIYFKKTKRLQLYLLETLQDAHLDLSEKLYKIAFSTKYVGIKITIDFKNRDMNLSIFKKALDSQTGGGGGTPTDQYSILYGH